MLLAVGILKTLMLKMTWPNFVAPFTNPKKTTEQNMIGVVIIRAGVWSGVTTLRGGKNVNQLMNGMTALRGGKTVVQLMSFKRTKTGLYRKKLRDGIL